jgi:hypothetical protein
MRSRSIPKCIHCRAVARPNILMFGDFSWISRRTAAQEKRFHDFLELHAEERVVIIECGAGTAIPTIRYLGERLGTGPGATLIRINPREPQTPPPHLSLPCSALEGLSTIDAALGNQ